MVGIVCTTYCKMLCPLYREKLIQQKSMKINTKIEVFIQRIMSFSRNVNLHKMPAYHEGHEGSTYCNVGQAGSLNYH